MVFMSCSRFKPFYHHRQTHGEFASLKTRIHLIKQNKQTKKLPVLALTRYVCILGSCAISVWLFVFSVSCNPEHNCGKWYKRQRNQLCGELQHPAARESTFQGASIITVEIIAIVITPDLAWNGHKGKEKELSREFSKNLVIEDYASKCFLWGVECKWIRNQNGMCVFW